MASMIKFQRIAAIATPTPSRQLRQQSPQPSHQHTDPDELVAHVSALADDVAWTGFEFAKPRSSKVFRGKKS